MLSKWSLPIAGLVALTVLSVACTPAARPDDGVNNGPNNALYDQNVNGNYYSNRYISNRDGTLNNGVAPRNDPTRGVRGQNEIGFVRFNPTDGARGNGGQAPPELYVDREALANQIGYLVTAYPEIQDALVLVTDDHVFVGIDDAEEGALDDDTVDKVKRTALSVTPRYYDAHVTDDETMRQRMTEIGDIMTNNGNIDDYRDEISDILREMGDDTPPRPRAGNGMNRYNGNGMGGGMQPGRNNR